MWVRHGQRRPAKERQSYLRCFTRRGAFFRLREQAPSVTNGDEHDG